MATIDVGQSIYFENVWSDAGEYIVEVQVKYCLQDTLDCQIVTLDFIAGTVEPEVGFKIDVLMNQVGVYDYQFRARDEQPLGSPIHSYDDGSIVWQGGGTFTVVYMQTPPISDDVITSPLIDGDSFCMQVTEIPQSECETLVAIYTNTQGQYWENSTDNNWLTNFEPCSWTGISCDDGHVIAIDLSGNQLTGTVPDLTTLVNLENIDLYDNCLTISDPALIAFLDSEDPNWETTQDNCFISTVDDPTQPEIINNINALFDKFIDYFNIPMLPEITALNNIISGFYNNDGQAVSEDFTVEENSSISNLIIKGRVINHGLIGNATITESGEIMGGKLTGYIINNGLLSDFEFVGNKLTGGILSGYIYNNSEINGRLIDVTLSANTIIEGGILEGEITGDCDAKALLKNVTVKSGSVLECVELGENVFLEENVEYPSELKYITLCSSSSLANEPAVFEDATGKATLPHVRVGTDVYFIEMLKRNNTLEIFDITIFCKYNNLPPIAYNSEAAFLDGNFLSAGKNLHIPVIQYGENKYSANLSKKFPSLPDELAFVLDDYEKLPFIPDSEVLKKAKEIGIDVENISYELYVVNEGTPAHPKLEETFFKQGENKFEEKCVHGDVYKLYLRLGNDVLPPPITLGSSLLISSLERKIKFSLTTSTYETKPTTAYQTNTQNIEKLLGQKKLELAEITCQHHATPEKPVRLKFEQFDVEYKNPKVGNMNLSEILGNLSKDILFLPKMSIIEILKRDVKFSTEFSPSNGLLGATLAELSYYNDVNFVKNILTSAQLKDDEKDARFEEVKFYSSGQSTDYQLYIAKRKQSGVPIIFMMIRGTQEPKDIITDVTSQFFSLKGKHLDLTRLGLAPKQNVFAAGFYEYAEYAYKTLLVYPQILNGNQPEINFLTGKNSTNNTFTALHKGEAKLFIAGHSLGAAAATILTTLLATSVDTDNMMTYVVGSPKSIAPSLGKNMNSSDFNIFNIQHPSDIVTWVPFSENEIPFWLLNFIPYLPVFVEQGSFTHINNIEKLDDFNISNLEDNHFIKSFFESFKTHSSNFYINSLHHLSTDNVGAKWEKQKGDDFEKIATKNYIFERGTCRRNSYIEKFDIYGSCHIDAEILKLEGQLDGNNAETYYIDNISHDINPPPRISKYEPSHHILNKYENDAEIQEVINGVFNRNNFESEGIKYNFADLGLKVNPVNQCRVYANGDFTCFNVKSEGTKGEDYYFKFEPDNAVYKLDKKEETKHPNFHFLGIHGK